MSTVNEVLNQSLTVMQHLRLKKIVCVFDQALYSKAVEITWDHSDKFQQIIVRLGVFHTICKLLGIIVKRFQDAGLRDLCIESGVIAGGSVAGVMDGRKYNRALRLHKLMYEACMQLTWNGFLSWLKVTLLNDMVHLGETLKTLDNLGKDISQAALKEVLVTSSCSRITELFEATASFSGKAMAVSQHSGCPIWTWLKSCWGSFEHPEREIGCYIWQAFEQ